jgi:2-polyprenyl-3-methyl-5-hydroxy-6-metoxy-1,4-benzoquinol methylase
MSSQAEQLGSGAVVVPPSPVVKTYVDGLAPYAELWDRNVLDVGCGRGRNSIHMYMRGYHEVTGIDTDEDALEDARQRASQQCPKLQPGVRNSYHFENIDLQDIASLNNKYSVVMANEVLHSFAKPDQYDILRDLQARTKPRGIHLISGYLLSKEVESPASRARMFNPGELQRFYASTGWTILRTFNINRPVKKHNGQEFVFSLTNLIARPTSRGY